MKSFLSKNENSFFFGFIGTFGLWHGVNVLEVIIPALAKENTKIHFLLMGDGVLRAQLEESFLKQGIDKNKVTFTGAIPQDKASEYLFLCDAFLCPTQSNADGSRFFGSPTKLFEYMSMAKPIIASDLEQLTDIIDPAIRVNSQIENELPKIGNQMGFLVDHLDYQGFIQACLLCYQLSEADRTKMGNNARAKVLEKYTWKHHVQRIINYVQL